jgi:hypothetical protein
MAHRFSQVTARVQLSNRARLALPAGRGNDPAAEDPAMREGSYYEIEAGMAVFGPDRAAREGRVAEVLTDEASDIFVGLVVIEGSLLHERRLFVPGECVAAVRDRRVELDRPLDEMEPYLSAAQRLAESKERYHREGPLDDLVV